MSTLPRSTRVTAAMALAVTTAGVTVLAHHHKHSATSSATLAEVGDVAVLNRSIRFGTRLRIDGNVYTVTDWIGHGSDVDLFFGDGPDCERRALAYGRRHLQVVEVGR